MSTPSSPYGYSSRETYPAHTPSGMSNLSSMLSGPSGSLKRSLPDGMHQQARQERKGSVDGHTKKKRISLSCAQCAKRKQKCNREFPCQHCLARKVPELCVPYNPQANSASTPDPSTASRLDKIESVLSVMVRHHGGLWAYKDIKDWMNDSTFKQMFPQGVPTGSSNDRDGPSRPWQDEAAGEANRAWGDTTGEKHELFDLERSSNEEGLEKLGELDGGMPESMEPGSKVSMKMDIHGTPAENLQRLITDCGVSPHKVAELVQELPPKAFADKVIDWFFSKFNYTRYPIDERLFRISYEDLYNKATAVDPSNVRALPLVFIVLALAVRLAPEEWSGDDQTRRLSSLRMYWSSRRSILIATAVQPESLELVVTRLLSAMYLVAIHDRRLTECWSQLGASLRTAQAIGLHRDGSKLGLDPFQTEYRRRIWSYLYHADKLYSLVLGRPPSISDSYTDTLPPSNVELNEFNPATVEAMGYPQPRPLSQPTSATFLILRKSLSKIVGKVVHHFQKLDEPAQYSDVNKLQMELDAFVDELPPHFRMHDPDKSLDSSLFWLPVHRFTLLTEILVTTIILHRPWLLRKLSSNRYAASRTGCFEAAKLDFKIRQDYQREVPDFKLFANTGQFKMFNSAMIAGISAIIDPRGPDGDYMRKILTTFLEQNPWPEVAQKDETTRKEVQIIQTLSRRAAKIYEDSLRPEELDNPDKDSVSLLLALRDRGDASAPPATAKPKPAPPAVSRMSAPSLPKTPALAHMSAAGMQQSPGSTASHEEDHSQRLLDHWLYANHSLAVGTINSQVPTLDPSGIGFLPLPAAVPQYDSNLQFNFSSTPSQNISWNDPSLLNLAINGLNGTDMNNQTLLGDDVMGVNNVPPPVGNLTLSRQMGSSQPMEHNPSISGGSQSQSNLNMEEELSDEYWNALIDGILGTTGGLNGAAGSTT